MISRCKKTSLVLLSNAITQTSWSMSLKDSCACKGGHRDKDHFPKRNIHNQVTNLYCLIKKSVRASMRATCCWEVAHCVTQSGFMVLRYTLDTTQKLWWIRPCRSRNFPSSSSLQISWWSLPWSCRSLCVWLLQVMMFSGDSTLTTQMKSQITLV